MLTTLLGFFLAWVYTMLESRPIGYQEIECRTIEKALYRKHMLRDNEIDALIYKRGRYFIVGYYDENQ